MRHDLMVVLRGIIAVLLLASILSALALEVLVPVDGLPMVGPITHWVPIEVIIENYSPIFGGLHVELIHHVGRCESKMRLLEV